VCFLLLQQSPSFWIQNRFQMGQVSMANKKLLSIIAAAGRSRNQEKRCRLYLVPVVSSRQYAPRKNRSRAPVVSCAPAASMMLILDSSFVLPQAFPWLLRTYLSFIDRVDCWMPCPYYHRNPLFAQSLAERPSRSCGRSTQFLARRS
jgi:hypothetical protein